MLFKPRRCVLLAGLFLFGCTHRATVIQPLNPQELLKPYSNVSVEPYRVVLTDTNGNQKIIDKTFDSVVRVKNGLLTVDQSAIGIQAIIGVACYSTPSGLTGSPYGGVRFFHLGPVGFDNGFTKDNFSIGIDYLKRTVVAGPAIAFPYLSTKPSGLLLKCGFLF